ncbi:MAG: hypothetical protein K2W95_13710 [Candidatus Obscuribacterales bacterium]|nr:hypothetical protein [Candidatus Obscuribacterales bacterium]
MISFPKDHSLGTICEVRHGVCLPVGRAQGQVMVSSKHVRLIVGRNCTRYLTDLRRLPHDAIDEIDLTGADVEPDDVALISQYRNLRSVSLKQNFGLRGHLRPLFGMPNLADLNLSTMGLHDQDLIGIEKARKLKRLVIDVNSISDIAVGRLVDCKLLNSLFMGKTKVTGKGLSLLRPSEKFSALSVSHLNVAGSLDQFICYNRELRYLDVSFAILSESDLRTLRQTRLTALYLVSTPGIDDRFVCDLFGSDRLRRLDISSTAITDVGGLALSKFTNLEELTAASCLVSDMTAKELAKLTRLSKLDLSDTRITDKGAKYLGSCKSLSCLKLSGDALTDRAALALKSLVNLRELDLSRMKLTDATVSALTQLPFLEILNLSGTKVTDRGLNFLRSVKSLRKLDLTSTEITTGAIQSLRRDIPGCRIVHDYN